MGCGNSKSINVVKPTPTEQNGGTVAKSYHKNANGLMERTLDYRVKFKDKAINKRPQGKPDNLYLDQDFQLKLPEKSKQYDVKWKRPMDFSENPKLFSNGTSRSDVGQGTVGNCWFLAVVANIADNKELMKQVLPKSAYYIEHLDLYDGIFHARFFSFGKWLDVYTDDVLPVTNYGTLLGAECKRDKNVMWVPLLEKAFAKLHGSYEAICSGQCGDAYLQLTGGIGEEIKHEDMKNNSNGLFDRVKNALSSNHQVTTRVPSKYHEVKGLIGNHAYSVVAVNQVLQTKLLQIRNPWGRIEWTGAWSEGSKEWTTIPENTVKLPTKDQGEFFVCLDDYMKYFETTTICSLTPDFDLDGRCNLLNHVLNIYGEWSGDASGGFEDRLKNPRFSFVVSKNDARSDGKVPIFVQMIQQVETRKAETSSILCDILRVVADQDVGRSNSIILEEEKREIFTFSTGVQYCYRFNLDPGCYVIIPTTINGHEMKAFLLRIFSPGQLTNVRQIPHDVELTTCSKENFIEISGKKHFYTKETILHGQFKAGVNDGGGINEGRHHTNPQYVITVPATGHPVPVVLHIMQKHVEPKYTLGLHLYKISGDMQIPLKQDYLRNHYKECEPRMDGERHMMYIAWDMSFKYLLTAGKYVAVVYLDKPKSKKEFAVFLKSSADLGIRGFQTGSADTNT